MFFFAIALATLFTDGAYPLGAFRETTRWLLCGPHTHFSDDGLDCCSLLMPVATNPVQLGASLAGNESSLATPTESLPGHDAGVGCEERLAILVPP